MTELRTVKAWARKHYNFMTPHIISIRKVKNMSNTWVELSSGEFLDKSMYGISIIEYDMDKDKFQTSDKFSQFAKSVHNAEEAEKYFHDVLETLSLIGKATIWK